MSTIDLSRSAHQPDKRYTSVRLQQGRVFLDDDWNEAESITSHERAENLIDVIGPSGTSDDALRVSNVIVDGAGEVDFDLGAGTIYVGGRRLRVPTGRHYLFQDDFFDPPPVTAPAGDRNDLVWVEVVELPVSAVEDAELLEVALGGPDTTARTRLVSRVMVETAVDPDCEVAWEATVGADVDERGQLTSDAMLTVGFVPDSTPDDLCTPAAVGGYLTHLNQAIRVQCTDATHFTWGFSNGAPLYRVELRADRVTVHFRSTPADEAHRPRAGQVVELLPWASVLSNGQRQAALSGVLAVVQQPFDPDTDELVLTAPVPAFGETDWVGRPDQTILEADGRYVFVRVWERGDDTSGTELAFLPGGAAVPLGSTGLEVSFSGTTCRRGDHWIIAARPAEPTLVVPWDFATGRVPHGPVRLRAVLGMIRWTAGVPNVHDCRRRFRPLTELQGCCQITVGDGSHSFGDVESIQAAIDALPPEGGRICVRPGHYDERVVISGRTFVEIEGCGPDTVIAPSADGDPVIAIDDSQRIAISAIEIVARDGEGVRVGHDDPCRRVTLDRVNVSASPLAAGVLVESSRPARQPTELFEMRDCHVTVRSLDATPAEGVIIELWPAISIQGESHTITRCIVESSPSPLTGGIGGIQVAGLSRDARMVSNTIRGGNGHGITLGSIVWVPVDEVGTAVADFMTYTARATALGWLVWFDGGCIQVGGDPPDDGDGGRPLVPLSVGPVIDVTIEDNEITEMAADGIGVIRFFEPTDDETADIVAVERIRIDRNTIVGNRRSPQPEGSPAATRLSGHGGVALAEVVDLRLRDNRIIDNGPSELVPTCGVFVLSGEALLFTGNDIADNGALPDRDRPNRIGNRGGIVVRSCRAASVGVEELPESPEIGALLIHDNRISQPAGQAIWAMGQGAMSIHDNQLSAGGLAATDIFAAALRMLEGSFDGLGEVASIAITHLAGLAVTVLNLGLPIDVLAGRSQDSIGSVTPGTHGLITTSAFLATDRGQQTLVEAGRSEAAVATPVAGIDDLGFAAVTGRLLHGGHVGFNDNQVTLDLIDLELSLALCSVLLLSFDDVAMQQNQVRCLTMRDLVLVDAIVGAIWTARCQGNRLQEVPAGRDRALLGTFMSLLSRASMNTTTGNQMSCPYLAAAADPTLLVDEHNLRWQ